MFKIEYNEENAVYNVIFNGEILDSFESLFDALDYRACMIWERDNAFADIE